jgi:arylsulfatase A-like enzyme
MPVNILVAVIDGLRASSLGAYGNTSIPTPTLDQFAAESMLFDSCYATSPELPDIYRALWFSTSQLGETTQNAPLLPEVIAKHGYVASLITDEPELDALAKTAGFHDSNCHIHQPHDHAIDSKAADPFITSLANLLNACHEKIVAQSAAGNPPQFVWLHARGMYGNWDAPLGLQEALLDESDPPPIDCWVPPDRQINTGDDPDIVFRYSCAYAAQIMAFDACWEDFVTRLLESSADDWLIVLIGARGFPLGEHGRIGGVDSRLYVEQLHVPWLIRFPDGFERLARVNTLTTHSDVLPTLLEWLRLNIESVDNPLKGRSALQPASRDLPSWRPAIISKSTTSRAIRTDAWCLRANLDASASPELYVRPDDRWEANDVAKLCPDTVEELRAM